MKWRLHRPQALCRLHLGQGMGVARRGGPSFFRGTRAGTREVIQAHVAWGLRQPRGTTPLPSESRGSLSFSLPLKQNLKLAHPRRLHGAPGRRGKDSTGSRASIPDQCEEDIRGQSLKPERSVHPEHAGPSARKRLIMAVPGREPHQDCSAGSANLDIPWSWLDQAALCPAAKHCPAFQRNCMSTCKAGTAVMTLISHLFGMSGWHTMVPSLA